MAERLTRIVVAHPKKVAIGWFAMLVLAMAASHTANPRYVNNLALPGTDSQRATDLLRRELPAQSGDTDQIVLHATTGLITDPAVRTRVSPVFAPLSRLPHVTGVAPPFTAGNADAISKDGRTAFATLTFDERADALPKAAVDRVIAVARSARTTELQIELGGRAIQEAHRPTLGAATAIGLIAALAVLLVTFGSLLAAGL